MTTDGSPTITRRDHGTGFAAIHGKLINLGIRTYRAGDTIAALFANVGLVVGDAAGVAE